jgi:hypothetical protein
VTLRGPLLIVLGVVFFLSLAANLLIAGFAAARFTGGPRQGGEIERIVAMGVRAFPPEIRQTIETSTRAKREEMRARLDDVQNARRRMFEAMRADPFNPQELEAANAELRGATDALQQAGQQIVLEAVADAPPDVRRKIRPPRGPGPGPGPRP